MRQYGQTSVLSLVGELIWLCWSIQCFISPLSYSPPIPPLLPPPSQIQVYKWRQLYFSLFVNTFLYVWRGRSGRWRQHSVLWDGPENGGECSYHGVGVQVANHSEEGPLQGSRLGWGWGGESLPQTGLMCCVCVILYLCFVYHSLCVCFKGERVRKHLTEKKSSLSFLEVVLHRGLSRISALSIWSVRRIPYILVSCYCIIWFATMCCQLLLCCIAN